MRINVQKLKWNLYQVQLYGDDGNPLFSESAELLSERKRRRLLARLRQRFPELEDKDVEGVLLERMDEADASHGPRSGGGRGETQAGQLLKLAEGSGNFYFRDDLGEAYAQVLRDGHQETWRCRSRDFRRWLIQAFMAEEGGKPPYREAVSTALEALGSKVSVSSPQYTLYNRTACYNDAFYYDLADEQWRVVKVTPQGWEIKGSAPAPLFRRYTHQKAQATPIPGGDPFQILSFINLQDEMAQLLLVVYLITCLMPDIPHPIPIVYGPGGAAKTTFCRLLRLLVDPSTLPLLAIPWEERELIQKFSHHWLVPFDNVSTLPDWVQDALCRACTGEGFSKRELYSDDEDVIYSFRRCVMLNGINIAATHSDLLRRAILFGLEEVPPERRQPERKLLAEFEKARPHILGGLFDTLSRAMALRVELRGLPSMADFAEWGAAISKALGRSQEAFLQAYEANIQQQHASAIESSVVASVLMKFMEDRDKWEGSPSQLYSQLQGVAEELHISVKDKQWPKNPSWLVRALNRVLSDLRAEGIALEWLRHHSGRSLRILGFSKGKENAVAADMPSREIGAQIEMPRDRISEMPSRMASHSDQIGRDASDANDGISPPLTNDEENLSHPPFEEDGWEVL